MTIQILRGEEWGMRWERPPVSQPMPVDIAYVHQTAGSRISDDAATAFRRLNEMAIGEGMSAIDYSLLVHRSPSSGVVTIGEARGPWLPAATYKSNPVSKAVCLMGYFHPGHKLSEHPHPDEIEGVAYAIYHAITRGWLTPTCLIRGHRENPYSTGAHATACPGDWFMPHMPTIRQLVAQYVTPTPIPPPPPTPQPTPVFEEDIMLRAAKLQGPLSWWVGDGNQRSHVADGKEGRLLAAAGLIDVARERVVHDWAYVGAVDEATLNEYVGTV